MLYLTRHWFMLVQIFFAQFLSKFYYDKRVSIWRLALLLIFSKYRSSSWLCSLALGSTIEVFDKWSPIRRALNGAYRVIYWQATVCLAGIRSPLRNGSINDQPTVPNIPLLNFISLTKRNSHRLSHCKFRNNKRTRSKSHYVK